jgi:hypothetical protein
METTTSSGYESPSIALEGREYQENAYWVFYVTFAPWNLLGWYYNICRQQKGYFQYWWNGTRGGPLGHWTVRCWR